MDSDRLAFCMLAKMAECIIKCFYVTLSHSICTLTSQGMHNVAAFIDLACSLIRSMLVL